MHTMWKGSVSFGLVNIPVKMFAATEDRDVRFKYLHKECNTPVSYKKTCPNCNKEVTAEDIVKGFEYEPGHYVVLSEEDFESVQKALDGKAIEIVDFVDLSEIDPIYFDKTYYLSPQETGIGGKAYQLLRQAMRDTGKIAVARITIRNKQSLCALRVHNNILILETIFYPDEIRPVSMVPGLPEDTSTNETELDIAQKLIGNLTTSFDPSKYTDQYRIALQELIQNKIQGKEIHVAPDKPESNVINLMEALQASLNATKKAEPKKSDARKKKDGTDKSEKEAETEAVVR